MSPITQRFQIPTSSEAFERLCRDLLRLYWSRKGFERFGKSGEEQFGIDLIDLGGEEPLYAAQCKLKEPHKTLPPADIDEEVNKAKQFTPALGKYGILTSAKVSIAAHRKIREINQAHRQAGLFEVELFTWEKICELIQQYPEVQEEHYGEIATGRGMRLERGLDSVQESVASLAARIDGDGLETLLNEAREAVNSRDLALATLLLNRLEKQKWHLLNSEQQFRVITNQGATALGLGRLDHAARLFMQALPLQPDSERAQTNEVLAYYLSGDIVTAHAKAAFRLKQYPASQKLASYWVITAPVETPVRELESALSPIMRSDAEVLLALAKKALHQQDLHAAASFAEEASRKAPNLSYPYLTLAQINLAWLERTEVGRGSPPVSGPVLLQNADQFISHAIRFAETEKNTPALTEALVLHVSILLLQGKPGEASAEADWAYRLDPDNSQVLLAKSRVQLENQNSADGIAALERAYSIDPNAEVAFGYGQALFSRGQGADLDVAARVLTAIKLTDVIPLMRGVIVTQALRSLIKKKDWTTAEQYLDAAEADLSPESTSAFRGFLAHHQGLPRDAERYALKSQSLLSSTSDTESKIFLARLFMLVGRPADALPLFLEAFDSNQPSFNSENLLDCASRLNRDDVVIETCDRLHQRGVDDWNIVAFGVMTLQKYDKKKAIERLDSFLARNPDHRLARLSRSVLGMMTDQPQIVNGSLSDLPTIDELPAGHVEQVVHVLRYVNDPDAAVRYAYDYLRLHFGEIDAHRALLLSMGPWGPMPNIDPTMARVEVGSAVCFQELPQGSPQWRVLEETENPSLEFEELSAASPIAREMLGKTVGETFLLAKGTMHDRMAVIQQIIPRYVRRYQDCLDGMQIRFGQSSVVESVPLGTTAEQQRESIERVLQSYKMKAASEEELTRQYSATSMPLHIFGSSRGGSAYEAVIKLAGEEDQLLRNCFGTPEERSQATAALETAACIVLDLSALATLQLLELENIVTIARFRFLISENTWSVLRETLTDTSGGPLPSIAFRFQKGVRTAHEETIEFKQERDRQNRAFLDLIQTHVQVTPVLELASLNPADRASFERIFGQYGVESMLLASKPDCVLWSDDLVQSYIAAEKFGARRAWTQVVITFLTGLGLLRPRDRDVAAAKLVGMGYNVTIFDSASILEAVRLADSQTWRRPLREFVHQFSEPISDIRTYLIILTELVVRLYLEPLLCESRCKVIVAFLDALWNKPAARARILNLRAISPKIFGLNVVGQTQFNDCFDRWYKQLENPIVLSL